MITFDERNKQFRILLEKMYEVQFAKGKDYAEDVDGLRNLRRRGVDGIVARLGDKLSRIENLIKPGKEASVLDESIDDTLIDFANYSLLLIILRKDLNNVSNQ